MNNNAAAPTILLIGIGRVEAIAYGDVEPGTRILFNYGYTYTVTAVERTGKASVSITAADKAGKEYTFTRRASSLIGIAR